MPDRTTPPPVRPFGQLSVPADTVEVLDNGLTLHRYSGGDQPVCRLSVQMQGGSAELGDAVGRLLATQFTEGTSSRSAEEIAEAIDYNGARINCRSQQHFTSVDLSVLSNRASDMLPVLTDMIANPVFPSDRLDVAAQTAVANLQTSRMDTSVLADEALMPLIAGAGHSLARRLEEKDFEQVSPADLAAAHRRILVPSATHTYLSGSFDNDTLDTVRRALASLPERGPVFDIDLSPLSPASAGTRANVDFPASYQSAVSIAIPAPERNNPDYVPLRLTVIALGGYFGSRLMTNIREEKGLTYGIHAALIGMLNGSYANICAKCDKRFTDTVIAEISAELRRLVTDPPQGRELERMRLFATTSLAEILDTPSGVMGYYAARRLVGAPENYFETQLEAIKALTPETIATMAERYLQPEKAITVVAGA